MAKNGSKTELKWFPALLLGWNSASNRREMPWKGEKDPYKIWLSEVILQQTRVDQGVRYYERFLTRFPTVADLASAQEETVFKLWEGLGYYSRARNLLVAANTIVNDFNGIFPNRYEEIKSLKGIGTYTAAAISSFAYNLPHAVLDGNVFRVLSRVFGIDKAIDSTEGKKYFGELANRLLDRENPGIYNQAIMDFGATICKPVSPQCGNCVFRKQCRAFLEGRIGELPFKGKKLKIRKRWFYYFIIHHNNRVAIRQRTGKDIWQQLHEFPMIETDLETSWDVLITHAEKKGFLAKNKYRIESYSPVYRQQLSHQLIQGRFITVHITTTKLYGQDWTWASPKEISSLAFPKFINQHLEQKGNLAMLL